MVICRFLYRKWVEGMLGTGILLFMAAIVHWIAAANLDLSAEVDAGLRLVGLALALIGLVVLGVAGVLCFPSCWFHSDRTRFGIELRSFNRRVDSSFLVTDYRGWEQREGRPCLLLRNDHPIPLPNALNRDIGQIDLALRQAGHLDGVRAYRAPVMEGSQDWANLLSAERVPASREPAPREARIVDRSTLRGLINQYRASVIFREGFPAGYDLARMFIGLKRSNGGLALFGARSDGAVLGLSESEVQRARSRLEHLAQDLTTAQVEIGQIEIEGKVAVFAVFNPVAAHLRPLEGYAEAISEVEVI